MSPGRVLYCAEGYIGLLGCDGVEGKLLDETGRLLRTAYLHEMDAIPFAILLHRNATKHAFPVTQPL